MHNKCRIDTYYGLEEVHTTGNFILITSFYFFVEWVHLSRKHKLLQSREDDKYESDGDSALQYDSANDDERPGFHPEAVEKQPEKEKRQRKPRSSSKLPTETQVVTAVNTRGVPTQPDKVARGYSTTIGLIVC